MLKEQLALAGLHAPSSVREPHTLDFVNTVPLFPLLASEYSRALVQDVVVNEVAGSVLHSPYKFFCDADTLLHLAHVTAPGGRHVWVPGHGGRVAPVITGPIWYDKWCAGRVEVKGTLSGNRFAEATVAEASGLYGLRESQKETAIGNDLLAAGFRTSLTLGTIVLRPDAFKEWIRHVWEYEDTPISRVHTNAILDVIENGDVPVLHVRVIDVADRMQVGGFPGFVFADDAVGMRYKKTQIAISAKLMAQELACDPKIADPAPIREVLGKIHERQMLSHKEVETYLWFLAYQLSRNAHAIDTYAAGNNRWDVSGLFDLKDTTVGGMTVDYEEAIPATYARKRHTGWDYLWEVSDRWARYVGQVFLPIFAPEWQGRRMDIRRFHRQLLSRAAALYSGDSFPAALQ